MATDTVYWLWLSLSLSYGSPAVKPLLAAFGDARGVFAASEEEIASVKHVYASERKRIAMHDLSRAEEIAEYCMHASVRVLTVADPEYPLSLLAISNPPAVLYVRGTLPDLNRLPCIGVVGARAMSYYGATAACEIAYDLGRMGCVTVSGLALGIDGVTAAATLASGGKTVAVMGSGIDRPYPREHTRLYQEIVSHGGAVVTEFAPYEGADAFHFPLRNRVISGISRALILVEGEAKSGALITANYARKEGKCVFAVPGKIGEKNSEAPHLLLKRDARLLTCADDVYDAFKEEYFSSLNPFALLPKVDLDMEAILRKYGVAVGKEKSKEKKLLGVTEEGSTGGGVLDKLRGFFGRKTKEADAAVPSPQTQSAMVAPDPKQTREHLDGERATLLSQTAFAVYSSLSYDTPVHPDEITLDGIGAESVSAELITMEVLGFVTLTAGGCYVKNENV